MWGAVIPCIPNLVNRFHSTVAHVAFSRLLQILLPQPELPSVAPKGSLKSNFDTPSSATALFHQLSTHHPDLSSTCPTKGGESTLSTRCFLLDPGCALRASTLQFPPRPGSKEPRKGRGMPLFPTKLEVGVVWRRRNTLLKVWMAETTSNRLFCLFIVSDYYYFLGGGREHLSMKNAA